MRSLFAALTVACLTSLMQACGQTGPLYMPDEPAPTEAAEAPIPEPAPTEAADDPITEPAD